MAKRNRTSTPKTIIRSFNPATGQWSGNAPPPASASRRPPGRSLAEMMGQTMPDVIPDRGTPLSQTKVGMRRLVPTGDDFGPYFVGLADEYYRGPSLSTRVAAHQFVPDEEQMTDIANGGTYSASTVRGHIYVKFQRASKRTGIDTYSYGPHTLADYQTFRESGSKGRSVEVLNSPTPVGNSQKTLIDNLGW